MKTAQKRHKLSYILILLSFFVTPFASFFIYVLDFRIGKIMGNYLITETTTIFALMILVFWFITSSDFKSRLRIVSISIGVVAALLVMYGIQLIWFLNLSSKFTTMGFEAEKEFSMQQDKYLPLITTIFDNAEKTNVRKDIDARYGYLFEYPKKSITVKGKEYEYSTNIGRKPVYFIRLKNGKLEKLFQSGDIKYEEIDTDGEMLVRDMLLGKVPPIQYPQHTCCGMDDVSWSDEVPFFRLFVPERRYLKDFYSELETILLIKDKNGSILGAMVDLHGD